MLVTSVPAQGKPTDKPETASILGLLRRETAKLHRQLDHDPLLAQLLKPTVAPGHYRSVLGTFYGFYAPLEAQLGQRQDWDHIGVDFAQRRKLPLLCRDLAFSGSATTTLALCDALPHCDDPSRAAGVFYVLEGSTLGGRMIARHLQATLGLSADQGLAFFSSYQEQVDQMWSETRRALLAAASLYGDEAAMVAGAQDAFSRLIAWFARSRLQG